MGNYARAGIHDLKAFYRDKFVTGGDWDFLAKSPIDRFDISLARMVWVWHHIPIGSRVLDFGCGTGTLAALKHKGCRLFGVELSPRAAEQALANGYEAVHVGALEAMPWPAGSFDAVVSLDVLGHIEDEHKDHVLELLKRAHRADGIALHGLECGPIDYAAMSDEELRRYVGVDGHVGIESRDRWLERFRRHYAEVEGEVRFADTLAADDLLKLVKGYGSSYERDLVLWLESLTDAEKRVFSIAMGLAFAGEERRRVPTHDHEGGLMLLSASDRPLERVEWQPLRLPPLQQLELDQELELDSPCFLRGWYASERIGAGTQRWSSGEGYLVLRPAPLVDAVEIELSAPRGGASTKVFFVDVRKDQVLARATVGPNRSSVLVPLPRGEEALVRIVCGTTVIPYLAGLSADRRTLGVALTRLRGAKLQHRHGEPTEGPATATAEAE